MSYSQNSEEQHILRIVTIEGEKNHVGRFLDIGAYNPKLFSNTRALFERGWGGVMVEASPGPFLDLMIEYGECERVELVCAAVGVAPKSRLVRFHHSEAGVGTSNDAHYQKWRDKAEFEGRFFASVITIGDLIVQFGIDFDFVNIDVEGESAEVFLRALNARLRPKCFCVEHDGRQEELTRVALLHGYCQEDLNGENVIFARQEGHDGN